MLSLPEIRALQFVKNSGGYATKENFIDDHEPVGEWLWRDLAGYIEVNYDGKIFLTKAGHDALSEKG